MEKIYNNTPYYISSSFTDNFIKNNKNVHSNTNIKKKFKNNKSYNITPNLDDLSEYIKKKEKIPKLIIDNNYVKIIYNDFIIIEELDFDCLILEDLKVGIDKFSKCDFTNIRCDVYFKIKDRKSVRELEEICEDLGVYISNIGKIN